MKYLLLSVLLFSANNSVAAEIKPFTSDGCSSFPDGTPEDRQLWLSCCVAHDKAYWAGGSYDDRLEADRRLMTCVAKAGKPEISKLMMAGVRVGGSPFFPTAYRWGYGWPYMRGYKHLSQKEREQVQKKLPSGFQH